MNIYGAGLTYDVVTGATITFTVQPKAGLQRAITTKPSPSAARAERRQRSIRSLRSHRLSRRQRLIPSLTLTPEAASLQTVCRCI